MKAPDWPTVEREAVDDLRSLLRFPTVNPPGNERPAVDFVAGRLREVGLEPEILERDGRPSLIARLSGDGSRGEPLLLAGHLDVVPVEEAHWTHPPFEAVVDGDTLFGRGALDMKNMVAMCLTVVRELARQRDALGRDVIFAAVADEEAGCRHGSRFLVEAHPDKVRAECMLGEFGAFSLDVGGRRFYPIQVAERGICRLELTATGEPGHGSLPRPDTAVVRLAEAVVKLGRTRLPVHRVATVEAFIGGLARHQPFPASAVLPRVLSRVLGGVVLDHLIPPDNASGFAAMRANTAAPTMLEAGARINVVPGTALARCDGRLLPGQTADDLVREVTQVVGPDIAIRVLESAPGRENPDPAHPLLAHLMDAVRRGDPDGIPLPFMLSGHTDALYLGRVVPHCFGFSPVRFPVEDHVVVSKLPHAHDERIHLPGFRWGLRVLWDAVSGWCKTAP